MTKTITASCFIFIFFSTVIGQTVIENPDNPSRKNAGRVVELTELMRIDDIGSDFFFKYPRNPKVSYDGHLFVQDYEQLLQFDPNGVFVRNYFKKGQGPGEMQEIGDYLLVDKMLIVHDRRLLKIICFDFEGEYIDNFYLKIPEADDPIAIMYTPMTISNGHLYRTVRNEDDTFSIVKYRIEDKK